ncbi:MAG: sulfite reductase (NADPH) hemoprotein beta-component [Myxococcota bacterium]|jgi:sulfite reductase (NADPH) hemoprotein beta-component
MYLYNDFDKAFVRERADEFRGQVERRMSDELSEDEFRPLRLMNGLYYQRHAYMLRIAVPYGLLSSAQMRCFGLIAEKYDRGYGHFTTRQNIQFNWMELKDVPDILDHLAEVEMNAIQTSGNCVRNITCDPLAGVAGDEILDVRPYCEYIRQYVALHPEFMYLPRKFKIAMTGATEDRAAVQVHDIGVRTIVRDGEVGFELLVGGGLGRTPRIGEVIYEWLPKKHLQSRIEAVLRVYNLHGRRDNKYKARIKILVGDLGVDEFRRQVDAEWEHVKDDELDMGRIAEITAMFDDVHYEPAANGYTAHLERAQTDPAFSRWMQHNLSDHKVDGYHVVHVSLKAPEEPPGDITTTQFHGLADLMDQYNQGKCTAVYNQNLVLQYIRTEDLVAVYDGLVNHGLATANIGTLQDMICCPGLDFCSLANATSIPIAKAINERFDDLDFLYDLGKIEIKMSGCINACAHHHVGDIGILGIDKRGEEFYQLAIGGSPGTTAADEARVAKILGPAVAKADVVDSIERIIDCFAAQRTGNESFRDTVSRVGTEPFKEVLYA